MEGEENTAPTPAQELVSVMGGVDVEVAFRNGSSNETVKVRELGADEIAAYAKLIDDEARTANLFCDKPEGWSKTLTAETFNKVMDTGQGLNLPLFGAWFRRSMERREATTPGIAKILEEQLREVIRSNLASPASSSPSPSVTG